MESKLRIPTHQHKARGCEDTISACLLDVKQKTRRSVPAFLFRFPSGTSVIPTDPFGRPLVLASPSLTRVASSSQTRQVRRIASTARTPTADYFH